MTPREQAGLLMYEAGVRGVTPVNGRLQDRIEGLYSALVAAREALLEIETMQPEPFAFPADWEAQIAACGECARYKSHPIQQGICDEHRRPLWARERWNSDEEKRLGYRAKLTARAALSQLDALLPQETR